MKFSLIVCTYQRPKALLMLLNSVQQQVLHPNEIIIVDGSLDTTTEHALKETTFQNVRYFKVSEKNRGLTKQRNIGISKVTESIEIVCFLDDDVILHPLYFSELIKAYTIKTDALAIGGYITNEVTWKKSDKEPTSKEFKYDNYIRKEGSRFILRKNIGLIDDTPPAFMPKASNGRSVSFLPPSGKIYEVELIMGGVSSYRKEIFNSLNFSTYFEGYGLYEDADFSLRISKIGKLYVNTNAKLEHYHEPSGRPNQYKYGKMVVRNGWYVWRVKYTHPSIIARFKWNVNIWLLIGIRFTNIFTSKNKNEAFTESLGRAVGWFSLVLNKPKIER